MFVKINCMDEMSPEEIFRFLNGEVTCRLGLALDREPYVVPLSYVYMNGAIHIHFAGGHGKKSEWIERNPNVCIEVDSYSRDHLFRRSVIVRGRAERVRDKKLLCEFIEKLAEKYPHFAPGGIGKHPAVAKPFIRASIPFMAGKIAVFQITPESITGRKSDDRT